MDIRELNEMAGEHAREHSRRMQEITEEQRYILNRSNQHFMELQGVSSIDPFVDGSSSSRTQMLTNNMGQRLVLINATERLQQTGAEADHANYTFQIKAPCDMRVLKLVNRYAPGIGSEAIRQNPETLVIFENQENGHIDVLSLVNYRSQHTTFGFRYVKCPAFAELREGKEFKKGTVFLQSEGISKNGVLMMGREANVCAMTLPGVGEDGIIAVEEELAMMGYRTMIRRSASFGPTLIPLNTYGNDQAYRICPDLGEPVRSDGLLIGLRPYSEDTSPYDHSIHGLQEFQHNHDRGLWVRHGGIVTDIHVYHDPLSRQPRCLAGTDVQLHKYSNAIIKFNDTLYNIYADLHRRHQGRLKVSPELTLMFRHAMYITNRGKGGPRIQAEQQKAKLDDWYVEFTIETEHTPDVGSKLSGFWGNKGVIVKKIKRADAPRDEAGNVADYIVSSKAFINRMIMGAFYGPKFNAFYRDVVGEIRKRLGIYAEVVSEALLNAKMSDEVLEEIWDYLVGFKETYSPEHVGPEYRSITDRKTRIEELAQIMSGDRLMFFPPDNEPGPSEIIKQLNQHYPHHFSPVTYRDAAGFIRTSKEPILIASDYMMHLDKTGDDWAAVNSSRLQHFGMLARITSTNKYASLIRYQPSRIWGEAEVRILVSYTPPELFAELADRSNNRDAMEVICWGLLTAKNPSNIDNLVDREIYPLGHARPNEIVNHVAEIGGWRFRYKEYIPPWIKQYENVELAR